METGKLKKFAQFWFTSDFFAVGMFAFAGVAMRVGIQNSLEGRVEVDPTHNYGPFIQMFYAKPYLVCNMVGCFVMSFCMTFMPQITTRSAPLYKGLTTGFCGCLTTFSSLMNDTVNVLWDRHWYKCIVMLLVEFLVTWSAFTMGFACAKSFSAVCTQVSGYIKPNGREESFQEVINVLGFLQEVTAQDDTLQPAESKTPNKQYEALELGTRNQGQELDQERNNSSTSRNYANIFLETIKRYAQPIQQFLQQYEYSILAALLIILCTVLWFILIFESQLSYFDNIKVRNTYRAVALAPLGAWTRWGLTKFPEIKNLWPEMHPQTMIANLAGVAIMCSLVVFSTGSWVYAIDAGMLYIISM